MIHVLEVVTLILVWLVLCYVLSELGQIRRELHGIQRTLAMLAGGGDQGDPPPKGGPVEPPRPPTLRPVD